MTQKSQFWPKFGPNPKNLPQRGHHVFESENSKIGDQNTTPELSDLKMPQKWRPTPQKSLQNLNFWDNFHKKWSFWLNDQFWPKTGKASILADFGQNDQKCQISTFSWTSSPRGSHFYCLKFPMRSVNLERNPKWKNSKNKIFSDLNSQSEFSEILSSSEPRLWG